MFDDDRGHDITNMSEKVDRYAALAAAIFSAVQTPRYSIAYPAYLFPPRGPGFGVRNTVAALTIKKTK